MSFMTLDARMAVLRNISFILESGLKYILLEKQFFNYAAAYFTENMSHRLYHRIKLQLLTVSVGNFTTVCHVDICTGWQSLRQPSEENNQGIVTVLFLHVAK